MYGETGTTGVRKLSGRGNLFEAGQSDVFQIETVELGNLKKIRIGHDSAGFGSSWLLDRVIVTHDKTKQEWYFLCGRWLAKDEDDGKTERELVARDKDGIATEPMLTYRITVFTGDRRGAGTPFFCLLSFITSSLHQLSCIIVIIIYYFLLSLFVIHLYQC